MFIILLVFILFISVILLVSGIILKMFYTKEKISKKAAIIIFKVEIIVLIVTIFLLHLYWISNMDNGV